MKKKSLNNTETLKFFDKGMLKEAIINNPSCCEPTNITIDGAVGGYIMKYHTHKDGMIVINSFEIQEISLTKPPKTETTDHYCSAGCRVS